MTATPKVTGKLGDTEEFREALARVISREILQGTSIHSDQAMDGVFRLFEYPSVYNALRATHLIKAMGQMMDRRTELAEYKKTHPEEFE